MLLQSGDTVCGLILRDQHKAVCIPRQPPQPDQRWGFAIQTPHVRNWPLRCDRRTSGDAGIESGRGIRFNDDDLGFIAPAGTRMCSHSCGKATHAGLQQNMCWRGRALRCGFCGKLGRGQTSQTDSLGFAKSCALSVWEGSATMRACAIYASAVVAVLLVAFSIRLDCTGIG